MADQTTAFVEHFNAIGADGTVHQVFCYHVIITTVLVGASVVARRQQCLILSDGRGVNSVTDGTMTIANTDEVIIRVPEGRSEEF
jgi:hypothetical protein